MRNSDGQVEVVLENKQLLLTFFAIVALCGVFFALGYIIGRNTFSSAVRLTQGNSEKVEAGNKPSPMPPAAFANQTAPSAPATQDQQAAAPDLNFYQSVEQKSPDTRLLPADGSAAGANNPSASVPAAQPAESDTTAGSPPGILVQVSALTRREDANALVALLKAKNLPVLVTAGANDSLFHVVVGPYQSEKDAEQAKALLESDGFRPIIRK